MRASRALLSVPGVWKVNVNYHKGQARVQYDAKRATVYDINSALLAIGYEGSLLSGPKG